MDRGACKPVVNDAGRGQALIEFHGVHLGGLQIPRIGVLIDGEPHGYLAGSARQPSFAVSSGTHRVTLEIPHHVSETVDVALSNGERVSLHYGFHRPSGPRAALLPYAPAPIGVIAGLFCFPLTGCVLWILVFAPAFLEVLKTCSGKPGACLYLNRSEPSGDLTVTNGASTRRQRWTILRVMVFIAAVALILGVAINERRFHNSPRIWP